MAMAMPLLLLLLPLLHLRHLQVPWVVITVMAIMVVNRTKVTSLERQDRVFIIRLMQYRLLLSLCCLLEEDSGLILLTSSSFLVRIKVLWFFFVENLWPCSFCFDCVCIACTVFGFFFYFSWSGFLYFYMKKWPSICW
jgi:hypothetical protein